jgi:hypothetical protein
VQLGQASGNTEKLIESLTAMIDNERVKPEDKLRYIDFIAGIYYSNLKDYDKAITWFKRYGEVGRPEETASIHREVLLLQERLRDRQNRSAEGCRRRREKRRRAAERQLNLLANIGIKTKDTELYLQAVEG